MILDDAADEVADQIISMARQTPDGLAFLDRVLGSVIQDHLASKMREVLSRLAQARFLPSEPLVTEI